MDTVSTDKLEGSSKPTKKRRRFWRILGRWLLSLLTLCSMLYLYAFWQCWRLEPTGDPLFDRFAVAVRNRWAWRLYGPLGCWPNRRSLLPEAIVARWESECGNDPNYWQLRYVCRKWDSLAISSCGVNYLPGDNIPSVPQPLWEPLQTAANKGIADENTLLLLYAARLQDLGWQGTAAQRAELLPLLDQTAALNPDLAWTYYLYALNSVTTTGEGWRKTETLKWLILGNRATDSLIPQAFPNSLVKPFIAEYGKPAGNKVLSGTLLANVEPVLAPIHDIKTLAKSIGAELETSGDRQLLDAYMDMLCRWGGSAQSGTIDLLQLAVIFGPLTDQLAIGLPNDLTVEQRADVLQLLGMVSAYRARTVTMVRDEESRYTYRFSAYYHLADVLSGVDSSIVGLNWYIGLPPAYQQHVYAFDSSTAMQNDSLAQAKRKLKPLAEFDYIHLRTPAGSS
jgi:hypothetical protein